MDQETRDEAPAADPRRVVLVHHSRHHFDVLLAFWAILRGSFDVTIWSTYLNHYGRQAMMEALGAPLQSADYVPGRDAPYDAAVLLTAEWPVRDAKVQALLDRTPTLGVTHALRSMPPHHVCAFVKGKPSITMADLAIPPASHATPRRPRRFLVQGNLEGNKGGGSIPRRDFDALIALVDAFPDQVFNVVGAQVGADIPDRPNLHKHLNLPEPEFYAACRDNDFLLPMVEPVLQPTYFTVKFTSSVLVGLGLGLPFVAHKGLFDLYPIEGVPYVEAAGLIPAVRRAIEMDDAAYAGLRTRQAEARARLTAANRETLVRLLHEVMATRPDAAGRAASA